MEAVLVVRLPELRPWAQGRDQKALAAVRTRGRIESAAADLYNVKRRKLEAKAGALRETTTTN